MLEALPSHVRAPAFWLKATSKPSTVPPIERTSRFPARLTTPAAPPQVRIQPSQAKNKLFLGGIPHELTREDLFDLLSPLVKGEPPRAALAASRAARQRNCCCMLWSAGRPPPPPPPRLPWPCLLSLRRPMPHHIPWPPLPTPASSAARPLAPLALPTRRTPPGLEKIDMVKSKDPAHPEQNRGFCFLEFYNAACAAAAKHTLSQPDFK